MDLGTFRIALSIFVCLSFSAQGADKYTDENRPYEFGFTIDGQQHRHEKKDKDGIIMGEFGFVTADDVYHVTVYATDKEGRFKILSMKNIHLKSTKTNLGTTSPTRQGHSLGLPPATSSAATPSPLLPQSSPKTQYKSISLEPPARSCSSCSIPTTTTRAPPPIPSSRSNQPGSPNSVSTIPQRPSSVSQTQGFGGLENSFVNGNNPQHGISSPQGFGGQPNSFVNKGNNPQQGTLSSRGSLSSSQPNEGSQNYPVSPNGFAEAPISEPGLTQNGFGNDRNHGISSTQSGSGAPNSQQGIGSHSPNPQIGSRSQFGGGEPGLQSSYPQTGPQQSSDSQRGPGSQSYPQGEEQHSYPKGGAALQSSNPQSGSTPQSSSSEAGSGPQSSYPQNAKSPTTYSQGGPSLSASYPSQGQVQTTHPHGGNSGRDSSPSVRTNDESHLESGVRTSKKYDGSPNTIPEKPTLVSAQMQIVDKNTDINSLRPGETKGLPPGLTQDDMTQLLYTFNYTVGFHGHFEEGFVSGVKRGYYYATGRNGVKTRIDYTADSTGFHPKVSQEVLDLLSEEVPKPETEKDDKYGLKGYEFKWLYYPVGSKR